MFSLMPLCRPAVCGFDRLEEKDEKLKHFEPLTELCPMPLSFLEVMVC